MTKTILIVDDEPSNIEVIAEALRQEDYRLLGAANGPDALERARKPGGPDLILLDVMMPSMDGFEVCRRLKEDPRTSAIPVIFITALDESDDEARGLELGAVDYISKPCSPAIVAARVRTHLALREHQAGLELLVAERTRELKDVNKRLAAEVEARKLAEMALIESEQRLREVLENLPGVGVYRRDEKGRFLWMNQEMLRMLGYGGEVLGDPGPFFAKLMPDRAYREEIQDILRRQTGDFLNFETRVQCGDGCERVFSCSSVSRRVIIPGWINWGVVVDITALKQVEEELIRAREGLELRVEERTAELSRANESLELEVAERRKVERALVREKDFVDSILSTSHDGISVVAESGELLFVSPGMERLFGYTTAEMGDLPHWAELVIPDETERASLLLNFNRALDEREPMERFFSFRHGSGETRHCRFQVTRMQSGDAVINGQDVTEIRDAQERIRHMALHDPLTGLPNRHLFTDRIGQALRRARRTGELLALLYVDLDRFKAMNDSHGHAFGDEVLKEAARRITRTLRGSDTVARIGGDEFVLLLQDLERPSQAEQAAGRVVKALDVAKGPGGVYLLGASVGVAIHPRDGATQDELLQAADRAMYKAKGLGGNRFWMEGGDPD